MNSLIDREVEIFQGRGPRRRQHLPSSLASKPLAHIPLQEPFQKGLQLGRKGIRELHVLWREEVQRDIPWWWNVVCSAFSSPMVLGDSSPMCKYSSGGAAAVLGEMGAQGTRGCPWAQPLPRWASSGRSRAYLWFCAAWKGCACGKKKKNSNKCKVTAYQAISQLWQC